MAESARKERLGGSCRQEAHPGSRPKPGSEAGGCCRGSSRSKQGAPRSPGVISVCDLGVSCGIRFSQEPPSPQGPRQPWPQIHVQVSPSAAAPNCSPSCQPPPRVSSTRGLADFVLNCSRAGACGLCLWMEGLLSSGEEEFISAYK